MMKWVKEQKRVTHNLENALKEYTDFHAAGYDGY